MDDYLAKPIVSIKNALYQQKPGLPDNPGCDSKKVENEDKNQNSPHNKSEVGFIDKYERLRSWKSTLHSVGVYSPAFSIAMTAQYTTIFHGNRHNMLMSQR